MSNRRRVMMNNSDITNTYMTIEALENGLTASLSLNSCQYCIDGDGDWITLSADIPTQSINAGHTLSFKATGLTPISGDGIGTFTISKKCNLKGSCMSLIHGDNIDVYWKLLEDYEFYQLFWNCDTIINVSEDFLPATDLSFHCYALMFHGCTSLLTAPNLPANVIRSGCYSGMFGDCTSLTKAPEILATGIGEHGCSSMFDGCTSLVTPPSKLPSDLSMGVPSYCFQYMFENCKSLTRAPELPATSFGYGTGCYNYMFKGCTNLNYIKAMIIEDNSYANTTGWMDGVASNGTFVMNSNTEWNPRIPDGWTITYADS